MRNKHLLIGLWMKLLLIGLWMILLVTLVYADWSIDNYKEHEGNKATIYDTVLFGDDVPLTTIELLSNTERCGGNTKRLCRAELKVTTYDDSNILGQLNFDKLSNSGWKSDTLSSVKTYLRQPDTTEGNLTLTNYKPYNFETLPAGTYEIKIEGDISEGETWDWIGSWNGVNVNEWAIWNGTNTLGLVNWWSFNETGVQFLNDTQGRANFTEVGTVLVTTGAPRPIAGFFFGNATNFTGDTANNLQSAGANTTLVTGNGTIEAWIQLYDVTPGEDSYLFEYTSSTDQNVPGMFIDADGTGNLTLRLCDTSNSCDFLGSSSIPSPNVWYYVAGVWNATDMMIFVDGAEVAKKVRTNNLAFQPTINNSVVGANMQSGSIANAWNGTIDELMLWTVTRNTTEILSDMNQTDIILTNILKLTPIDNRNFTSNLNINMSCSVNITVTATHENITNISFQVFDNTPSLINDTFFTFTASETNNTQVSFLLNTSDQRYEGNETFNWNCFTCLTNDQCSYSAPQNFTGSEDNFTFFIDNVLPQIFLVQPTLEGNVSTITLEFNVSDLNLQTCFFSVNGTANVTQPCGTNSTTISVGGYGFNNFTFYANDTVGNTNLTGTIYLAVENIKEGFRPSVTNIDNQVINITLNDLTNDVTSATLRYDSVDFFGSIVETQGFNDTYQSSFTLNFTSGGIFNWTISAVVNGTARTHTYPSITQEISSINIAPTTNGATCEFTNATEYTLNFTFRNEDSNALVTTGVNVTQFYNVWTTTKANSVNFTWNEAHPGVSSYPVCIFPNQTSVQSDFKVIFTLDGNATREFNLQNQLLNNLTQNFTLLMVDDSETSTITINVVNTNGIALVDHLLKIYIRDFGNATVPLKLVDSKITNTDGQVVSDLDTDEYYQFEVWIDGILIHVFEPFVVQSTEITLIVPLSELLDLEVQVDISEGVTTTLTYNNITGNVTGTWNDPNDVLNNVCLTLSNTTSGSINAFSNQCSISNSDSLISQIGTGNQTFFTATLSGEAKADGFFYTLQTLSIDERRGFSIFGTEAVYWATIGVGTLSLVVAPSITTAIIVGLLVLVVLGYVTNIIALSWTIMMALLIIGGLIIILLKE